MAGTQEGTDIFMAMKENYLISIKGKMELDGDNDSVELLTRGSFIHRNGNFFIRYTETEATGYGGNVTVVKIENGRKVSMTRRGTMPSELIVERGRRHVCHYDSPFGALSLGVAADEINSSLGAHGGELKFSYVLDADNVAISRNEVRITVKKSRPGI